MGAEESIIKSFDVDPPYSKHADSTIEGGQNQSNISTYAIHPARHRGNGSKVSIFVYNKKLQPNIGSSCAETLKFLRHPYILKFIDAVETEKQLKLITEDVAPLSHHIHCLESFEIISGLHNILEALIFLHEKVKLVHGNLKQHSIFVSNQDGSWKLGGMEKATKCNVSGIKFDILCFAEVAKSLLNSSRGEEEQLFLHKLETEYADQEMFHGTELKDLLLEPIFMNGYLDTLKFLSCITMKSENEKKLFFRGLGDRLRELNPETVAKKLLPKLMSKMILAEPSAERFFIPHLWKYIDCRVSDYKPVLPKDEYLEYCVPLILKLLRSKQVHVRLTLLKYISLFAPAIDKEILEEDVLPLILIGLRDENDAIVTATFHGLASIVPILGGTVVVGGERRKYFFDNRPNLLLGQDSESYLARSPPLKEKEKIENMKIDKNHVMWTNKKISSMQTRKLNLEANRAAEQHSNNLNTEMTDETNTHKAKQAAAQERMEKTTHDESEAEWEGFEAVTSESESEEKFELDELKAVQPGDNLLAYANDSFYHVSESAPQNAPNLASAHVKQQVKVTAVHREQCNVKPSLPKRLGEEFEFDIAVKSEEPDFFADMMPDLAIKKAVVVENKVPFVSSKFEAADDEQEYGWETDDW